MKPPDYSPPEPKDEDGHPPTYNPTASLPPTYDQAEKLIRGEPVDYDPDNGRQNTDSVRSRQSIPAGGYCEFFLFFLVCLLFGWIGYLFSCCFMTTVAASTGGAAGFGLSLIQTAVLYNVFQYDFFSDNYFDQTYFHQTRTNRTAPTNWTYDVQSNYFIGWVLWILAFCGLLLFLKSLITFGRAKNEERRLQAQDQ